MPNLWQNRGDFFDSLEKVGKVREGKVGGHRLEMTTEQISQVGKMFASSFKAVGISNYVELK